MSKNTGLTLIELVVTMAILAILASIAYPSYTNYTVAANRSVAQQFMMEIANRQEQRLLDTRQYASDLTSLNVTEPAEFSRYYKSTLAVDNTATPPVYTITATPITGKTQAKDGELTLNSAGYKTPAEKW